MGRPKKNIAIASDNEIRALALSAMLPGMRKLARDITRYVDQRVEEMEREYQTLLRPSIDARMGKTARSSGWSKNPAERSREMLRRQAVTKQKRAAAARAKKLHPRDAEHPDHEKWLARMRRGTKKHWNSLTEDERKVATERMLHARSARNVREFKAAS